MELHLWLLDSLNVDSTEICAPCSNVINLSVMFLCETHGFIRMDTAEQRLYLAVWASFPRTDAVCSGKKVLLTVELS